MKNMEEILNEYYENNAKKLHTMVDNVLFKIKHNSTDKDDFYSLANVIFVDVMNRYDNNRDFECFLFSCLSNGFKTELTRRNRYKRQADREAISINTNIGSDEDSALIDIIPHKDSVETLYFKNYSDKMMRYLDRLSDVQKEVLQLLSIGYSSNDIQKKLHINNKEYTDCVGAIRSFRNITILMCRKW